MPIKQAAAKALRQSTKHYIKNARERAQIEGLLRHGRKAIAEKAGDAAALVTKIGKALDKALAHGVYKKNTVARLKSRLMKKRKA